jgi:hypothetical protein
MNTDDWSIEESMKLSGAKSILRAGRKVFLRRENPLDRDDDGEEEVDGGGDGGGEGGEYRLVEVHESYDHDTGMFKVLWRRGDGRSKVVAYELISSDQVLPPDANRTVFVDHEFSNGTSHDARIIDLMDGGGHDVRIKWDRRDEEVVCASRIWFGSLRRRDRRRMPPPPVPPPVASVGTRKESRGKRPAATVSSSLSSLSSSLGGTRTAKRGKVARKSSPPEVVDLLLSSSSSSSSSSSDDDDNDTYEDELVSLKRGCSSAKNDGGEIMPASSKRNKVSLIGFCRSLPEYREDPHKIIRLAIEMLEKANES